MSEKKGSSREASVVWEGNLREGKGTVELGSGLFTGPYSFDSRFADAGNATTPEELIAAAHSSCFTMATCAELTKAGHPPVKLSSHALVVLEMPEGAPTITKIHLTISGEVPGITEEQFKEFAATAKAHCPISRALAGVPEITLEATLS